MKKKIAQSFKSSLTFIMTLAMVLTLVLSDIGVSITVRADEGVTLKLHYHREDGGRRGCRLSV